MADRHPEAIRIGSLSIKMLTQIAMKAEAPATREVRLRQVHEINPGQFHEVANVTPDCCDFCVDEVT